MVLWNRDLSDRQHDQEICREFVECRLPASIQISCEQLFALMLICNYYIYIYFLQFANIYNIHVILDLQLFVKFKLVAYIVIFFYKLLIHIFSSLSCKCVH